MAVSGVVDIRSLSGDGREARLHCENNGLRRPLPKCNNKELGAYGEELASLFLVSRGLEILETNWRCSFGEVDIVAEQDGQLVLVEVKTRIADPHDEELAPELGVNYRKQSKYQKLALLYLSLQTRLESVRFDVVAVKLVGELDAVLRHYTAAFEWDD